MSRIDTPNKNQNRKNIMSIIYRTLGLLFLFGSLFFGINYIRNTLSDPEFAQLVQWFVILIVLNLMVMIFIFYSYSKIRARPGLPGPQGYKGMTGKPGKISTCAVCEKEVPIMEQKYDSVILQEPILDDIDTDPSGTIAKIWDKPNREGTVKYLSFGNYRKLSNRFRNNLQSLEIKDGYMITIYSEEDYGGFKEHFPSGYYANIKETSELSSGARSLKIEKARDIDVSVNIWPIEDRMGLGIDLVEGQYSKLAPDVYGKVSSIKIPKGYQVFLFSDENFKGRRLVLFGGYYRKVGDNIIGFSNNVKSIIIKKGQPIDKKVVQMWKHPKRQGRKVELEIGWYDSLQKFKMNNNISCVEVPKGYKVTVFQHGNFKGKKEVYRAGYYWYLKKAGSRLNDRISSCIVEYDI